MMWLEERASLTPELATSVRLLLNLSDAGLFCSVGLLLAGVVILALACLPQLWGDVRRTQRNR
jgi:hypothetical protein